MIKTPLSTVIGGAFWTPGATVINGKEIFSVFVKSLFANGEQGFAYDPNDLTTMFQDAAGTVPVTGAGQPVGLIRDKSGRNNHAFATSSATRPILRKNATTGAYYLAFDGTDDFLVTSSINFTATDKLSLFAGVRKLSDAATGIVCELSSSLIENNGTFYLLAPTANGIDSVGFTTKGTVASEANATGYVSPASLVITGQASISTPLSRLRINGVIKLTSTASQGTGNYGNYPLYIGGRAGTALPFNGHIYSLIGIGRLTTIQETTSLEKSIAKNVGVTL